MEKLQSFRMLHTPLPIRENIYASEPAYGRSRSFVASGKKLFCCIAIMLLVAFSDIFGYIERHRVSMKSQNVHDSTHSQVAIQEQFLRTVPIPSVETGTAHYCSEFVPHWEVDADSAEVELRDL